ncbi:unnamed protein product [Pleuronectes platessa]|uniref:Uncharacterized protein n=1 Tax=Pleuronectes platessa TaxID=8262 RepID=A0A9N7Z515_PLEPL|nr:unnamed protein product [Pleuronectes platessa]
MPKHRANTYRPGAWLFTTDAEATLNRRAALIISVDPVDRCTALCQSQRRLKHRAAPRLPRVLQPPFVSSLNERHSQSTSQVSQRTSTGSVVVTMNAGLAPHLVVGPVPPSLRSEIHIGGHTQDSVGQARGCNIQPVDPRKCEVRRPASCSADVLYRDSLEQGPRGDN